MSVLKKCLGISLLACSLLVACSQEVEVTRVVEVEKTVEVEVPGPEVEVTVEVPGPEVEVTRIVEVMVEPNMPAIPFEEQWLSSGHADTTAEAFVHWNEDDPAEVPANCARCHSTPGYIDFIGADGTEAGVVDHPAPIGTTVTCEACHNEATVEMTSVTFPSGVEVTGLGAEARCMQCHQGRASTVSVNQSIIDAGATGEDEISEDLGFTNIHYYAAAATQYGNIAMGGYEYDGKSYDSKFEHVEGYDTCVDCHDPHTLEVEFDECTACHNNLRDSEDLLDIRMPGSLVDYDGDGDIDEGVFYEIEGVRAQLYLTMQAYATQVVETPILYDSHSYPYFFIDTNGNGENDEGEVNFGNRYNTWTPRLAKAAYNYQVSLKDPGRFAHGGKYIIQLLYDSLEDLNSVLDEPIDMSAMHRIDHGHFAGSEEAFRHWDEDGFVSASCSKCHSADGLPFLLEVGVTANQPTSNGLKCSTCHSDLDTFAIREVEEVTFPSGATVSFGENDLESNLCISCHQGRESAVSVDRVIGDLEADTVGENLRFLNIHYFAAGATVFGSEVQGGYQYAGLEYAGRNEHVGIFDTCAECHDMHSLEVVVDECAECHKIVESREDLVNIRRANPIDYDGDGNVEEGIAGEVETMREALITAMQAYTAETEGVDNIMYVSYAYPYFYVDGNGNGVIDEGEVTRDTRYGTWTPRLLRAAYNYQYAAKDLGAFAHNPTYILQLLYDSVNDLGGDTSGMTRATVEVEE